MCTYDHVLITNSLGLVCDTDDSGYVTWNTDTSLCLKYIQICSGYWQSETSIMTLTVNLSTQFMHATCRLAMVLFSAKLFQIPTILTICS